MRIDKLRAEYRTLLEEFTRQTRAAGAIVHASDPSLIASKENASLTEVSGFYYLKEWPQNSGSKRAQKKLDILVRSFEVYETGSLKLTKSVIQIMYFNASSDEAIPSLGLHYDYEYRAGAAHPIFHAQFGSSTFTSDELKDVKFSRTIQEWKDLVRVRIPTVHIGLPAAFLSLFADHLPHERFVGFLRYARSHQLFINVKARMDCRNLPLSEVDGCLFQAHNLYT